MSSILFAAVADDDTGATDLAGMLQAQGVRSIVLFDTATHEQLTSWSHGVQAVILGTASRSLPRAEAYRRTRNAVRLLRSLRPRVLFVKYCSTFDSTPEGNIGASIEAALDETGASFTIAVPALPVQGRTTYMGHHFVGDKLLCDSSMRHHPLTPMSNPNLVSHLATQTSLKISLAPHADVTAGPESLRLRFRTLQASGCAIAIVDCTSDSDLRTIAEAARDLPLLTGSSALGMVLPRLWNRASRPTTHPDLPHRDPGGQGFLIVAGSCSEATRRQNEELRDQGCLKLQLDPVQLASALPHLEALTDQVGTALQAHRTCLISTCSDSANLENVQSWAKETGISQIEAGNRIALALTSLTRSILRRVRPEGLIIAGGETSSTMCRGLDLGGVSIGPNIAPGVPVCVSLNRPRLPLVLKSGNFGGDAFYRKAIQMISSLPFTPTHLRSEP